MSVRNIGDFRHIVNGYGKSLSFDGVNDYATIPGIIPSTSTFSFSFWLKMASDSPTFGRIFDYYYNNRGTRFLFDSASLQRFNFDIANGSALSAVSDSGFRKYHKWYHFAGVYNGSSFKLYINGDLHQTQSKVMTTPTVAQILTIGRKSESSGSFGKFKIAHLAWDNDNEWDIDDILSSYFLGTFPSTASWYNFDSNVEDQSGNGNNITLNEGTTYSTEAPHSSQRSDVPTRYTLRSFGTYLTGFVTGGSSYVLFENEISLSGEFTISLLLRRTQKTTNDTLIGHSTGTQRLIFLNTSHNLFFRAVNSGASINGNIGWGDEYKAKWTRLTVTRDSANVLKAYINDGPAIIVGTLSGTFIVDRIGDDAGTAGYVGSIDDVLIFSRSLSEQEKSDFYNSGIFDDTNLELFYKFDEGSGSVAIDSSNSENNGAIVTATYATHQSFPLRSNIPS